YLLNYLKLIKMFPFLRMIPGLKERFILTESLADSMIALTAYGDIGLIPMVFRDFSMEQALETRREIFKKSWESNIFETLLTYEQRTYLVELLLRQDKMCMANAIENRVPFLDYHVVEFSKKIPTDYKVSTKINVLNRNVNYHTKKILKKIALNEFSKDFVYRSKLGFGIPMHEVFCSNGFKGLFNTYKERIKNSNIFDTNGIDILFQGTIKGDPKSIELFWIIFSFGIWYDRFINQKPQ
ncbi:MAG: asparagine synthase-related protein, partial [Nitrospinota bacterium]